MIRRRALMVGRAAVSIVSYMLIVAPAASAEPARFARKLGAEINAFNVAVFIALVGLASLPLIFSRDVKNALILFLVAVIIAPFTLAPELGGKLLVDLARSILS